VLLTVLANRLLSVDIPIGEKVVRTVAVYVALLLILRLGGKRTMAQMNAFDLVVLLLVSNVVQNAIIGPDDSLTGGLIGALVLVVGNDLLVRLVHRSALDGLLEGSGTPLVEHGSPSEDHLRKLGIRRRDLLVALRSQGAESLDQAEEVCLYPSGALVVELRTSARGASVGDVARLEEKLDELKATLDRLAGASP
jgi:uncharacterized membrane protein YcaP (DUF421 family)